LNLEFIANKKIPINFFITKKADHNTRANAFKHFQISENTTSPLLKGVEGNVSEKPFSES